MFGAQEDPLTESMEGIEDSIVRLMARNSERCSTAEGVDCPHEKDCTRRHGPFCPGRAQAAREATWHRLGVVLQFDGPDGFAGLERNLAGLECPFHRAVPILTGRCELSRRAFVDLCCEALADQVEAAARPSSREWTAETRRRLFGTI